MNKENNYCSDLAIHPGKTLNDILETIGMTQANLAQRTGLSAKTINEIIQGKTSITPETAIKLSDVFGMSAAFWNNLEIRYQEILARIKRNEDLQNEIDNLQKFSCYKELAKLGYVKETKDKKEKVENLLSFFGVSSLNFLYEVNAVAFRKSKGKNLSQEAVLAWLRCGDIEAQKIRTERFDKDKLISSIPALRSLTIENPENMQKELVNICASFGVAVVFTPYLTKSYVNGATRWVSSSKAIIQLSLRGNYSDIFWFTFFHELCHILRHGKKDQFIEFEKEKMNEEYEKEADEFAGDILIPKVEFQRFKQQGNFSNAAIIKFARRIGVSISIVAGRLSHEFGNWKEFAHLRDKWQLLPMVKQ